MYLYKKYLSFSACGFLTKLTFQGRMLWAETFYKSQREKVHLLAEEWRQTSHVVVVVRGRVIQTQPIENGVCYKT